jgi:tetratricopeptide (TPR) repeat protein
MKKKATTSSVSLTLGVALVLGGCASAAERRPGAPPGGAPSTQPASPPPSTPAASSDASAAAADFRAFEGLGRHTRTISRATPEGQRAFDQGLAFLFAFNHDEALRAFRAAAALAPDSPMPHWGIATANGPHINNPVVPAERSLEASAAVAAAQARLAGATEIERGLVGAVAKRFPAPGARPPADRRPFDEAYASAMRALFRAHPEDSDVGALFAEAMMDLRPWDLWADDGTPHPGTEEIVKTLEEVMAASPDHPLALHLYIHAVEASKTPERAVAAADRLRDLTPGLGHLVHMPSHIDVRVGQWQKAVAANQKAIVADTGYARSAPEQGFYRLYMSHNRHMLAFAAMMRGQSELALREVQGLVDDIPAAWIKENAALADGMLALPLETQMRFGRWEEILAAPDFPPELPLARAMRRAARGIALAAKGKPKEARVEQEAFIVARGDVPQSSTFGNNSASDLLNVASRLLEGEILLAEKKTEPALAALREAVAAEDKLRYDEPPDWIQPVRHALGAALLRAKKAEEAEQVYREDLKRQPDNGWALFGLGKSLRAQKKIDEAKAVEARFQEVWRDADFVLSSSCLCVPGV